jgi:mannose-6-phosphate isomerase-like protein (cupin superfamily)
MSLFTHKNLNDVEDKAPGFGHGESVEARFANGDLDTENTGVSFHRIKPDQRQPFGHRHEEAEEVYVVVRGSGRAMLGEELVELKELDAVRVSPRLARAFEAGPDGLELLAFGPRHERDGEILPGWWGD